MKSEDKRWHLRLQSLSKALHQLNNAVELANSRQLTDLEKQGLIQSFEFSHELAWNVMKDYFNFQGNMEIHGSRDAIRNGVKYGLIQDGEVWMSMILSRNKTTHTYDEATAHEIVTLIITQYARAFHTFYITMENLKETDNDLRP